MPGYSGIEYYVYVSDANDITVLVAGRKQVTSPQWDSAFDARFTAWPGCRIIGRRRNNDVELFEECSRLRKQLEVLGYTITHHPSCTSEAAQDDKSFQPRTASEKLSCGLLQALKEADDVPATIVYALIAGTTSKFLLVLNVDKDLRQPFHSPPETYTANQVSYPVLGQIIDDDITFHACEDVLAKYIQRNGNFVSYRWHDAVEKRNAEEAEERKRAKRRAKRASKKTNDRESG